MTKADGTRLAFADPHGYTPADIQTLYHIDPSLGDGVTIAVVDAYGYQDLESDLAMYRAQFGIPACTVASGCLTILNNAGQSSPLLMDTDQGWIGETALDVQMVSAACPKCKIVVVQTDGGGNGLEVGQLVARDQAVDAISNSWGGNEYPEILAKEGDYNNPGIGTFASTGDSGYAPGPQYPASSAFVVAVGGVSWDGTTSTAWSGAGSGCSGVIPKQTWSPIDAPCQMRAYSDISALADPQTGVAVFNQKQGKWQIVGGTSAATPIAAALFAAAGHADARPAFVYAHRDAFRDVVGGSNGTCGNLCDAIAGWDGPTGVGYPDQAVLKGIGNVAGAGPAVAITYPKDGADVTAKFTIAATPDPTTAWLEIRIDGTRIARLGADPWTASAPGDLAKGPHTVTAIAYDLDHNSRTATSTITLGEVAPKDDGICSAAGGRPSGLVVIAIAGLVATRRRKR